MSYLNDGNKLNWRQENENAITINLNVKNNCFTKFTWFHSLSKTDNLQTNYYGNDL